jgi:hypothetical protein
MEKNLFQKVFKRENLLLNAIFIFFFKIASYPRLLIEVFLRRNMGRRYFGRSTAVTVAVLLSILPIIDYKIAVNLSYSFGSRSVPQFFSTYGSWYVFVVLFIAFAAERARESYPTSNFYDYNYFSLSTGTSLSFFYDLPLLKKRLRSYDVEVYLEPLTGFLVGLILLWLHQPLGSLLIFCAIAYSFSYAAAYKFVDDELQDLIDKIIANEEKVNAFVYGKTPDQTRGFNIPGGPSDEGLRRKMSAHFFSDQEVQDVDYEVV